MQGTEAIVDTLREHQKRLEEPDGAFARRLGVTRTAWQMVRTGTCTPGQRMLRGAVAAFPELTRDVMDLFLPAKVSMLNRNGQQEDEVPA